MTSKVQDAARIILEDMASSLELGHSDATFRWRAALNAADTAPTPFQAIRAALQAIVGAEA